MKKTNNRKILITAAVILAVLILAAVICLNVFSPRTSQGAKTVTIEVVDPMGAVTTYTTHTDAEYLRQALEETKELEIAGSESQYGLYVETVNGVTADYSADGAYWAFYVDGEYCNYGVDEQPVNNGETYRIVYETMG